MATINDLKNVKLPTETLRTLYRTFRAAAMAAGESASDFDAWCVERATTRQFAEGISRDVLIVDEAAYQAASRMFVRGGFMPDTASGEAFLSAHGWPF